MKHDTTIVNNTVSRNLFTRLGCHPLPRSHKLLSGSRTLRGQSQAQPLAFLWGLGMDLFSRTLAANKIRFFIVTPATWLCFSFFFFLENIKTEIF